MHLHGLLSNTEKTWSCCPKNWKPFTSSCYLISSDSRSWNESQSYCSAMAAHLLVINSKEEEVLAIRKWSHDFHLVFLQLSWLRGGVSMGFRHWCCGRQRLWNSWGRANVVVFFKPTQIVRINVFKPLYLKSHKLLKLRLPSVYLFLQLHFLIFSILKHC